MIRFNSTFLLLRFCLNLFFDTLIFFLNFSVLGYLDMSYNSI